MLTFLITDYLNFEKPFFNFDVLEKKSQNSEIKILKENGASGFVIGCLKQDRTIDFEQTARLVRAARSENEKCAITFHRAFDIAVISCFRQVSF